MLNKKSELEKRGQDLESAFFREQDAKLLERLRVRAEEKARKESIAQSTGIDDADVLEKLCQLGLCGESVVALYLVPLIEVAWADGDVHPNEREAILNAAVEQGISQKGLSFQLLESWLDEHPGPEMLEAWENFMRALRPNLSDGVLEQMHESIMQRARGVASAAGGVLGLFGKISDDEKRVLDQLDEAFKRTV